MLLLSEFERQRKAREDRWNLLKGLAWGLGLSLFFWVPVLLWWLG